MTTKTQSLSACPRCSQLSWIYAADFRECEGCGHRAKTAKGFTSMKDFKAAQLEKARSVPDGLPLEEWYVLQREAVSARLQELEGALRRNLDRLEHATLKDDRWPRYWKQQATYNYVGETLRLLTNAEHCLVCPAHGMDGVLLFDFDVSVESWDHLSLRGLVTGEGEGGWQRACESCAEPSIRMEGERLLKEWRQ